MAPLQEAEGFREGIGKLYDSGLYSDAQIVVGTSTFAVHKAVLCTQSEYFARAFDVTNGFKESRTNVIVLEESTNPAAIGAMVEYIYKGDYSTTEDIEHQLAIDAAVYGAAEMFQIHGLKRLAVERAEVVITTKAFSFSNLASVVGIVYDSTPDTDRHLRDMLVKTAKIKTEKENLLGSETFNSAMQENGAFSSDLVHVLFAWVEMKSVDLKCKICQGTTVAPAHAFEDEKAIMCETCGVVYGDRFWVLAE